MEDDGSTLSWLFNHIGAADKAAEGMERELSEGGDSTLLYCLGVFFLFALVIYLLCHTADNYFSPVLAVICDLLDMSPDVAGVTFLAFGNGAPDVFSCLAALTTTSGDREAALLVGAGSLLGSAMFTITIVVGGVLHVKPTAVPPLPFTRDVLFLALALLLIVWSAVIGEIALWMALSYIAVYGVYVVCVFITPSTTKNSGDGNGDDPEIERDGGEIDLTDCSSPECCSQEDSLEYAHWLPENGKRAVLSPGRPKKGFSETKLGGDKQAAPSVGRESTAAAGGSERGTADADGDVETSFANFELSENHFHVPARLRERSSNDEEESLLGRDGRDRNAAELSGLGEVFSMVPGSTVSMFLEEDDSAASWLAQRRWGGRVWGRGTPRENRDDCDRAMAEPLLLAEGFRSGARAAYSGEGSGDPRRAGEPGIAPAGMDPYASVDFPRSARRRFEDAWATLQWRQWRLRRRLRRQILSSDFSELPWYRQVFKAIALPFVLVRNATIPPVETASWSKLQAAMSMTLAPLLWVWAFGVIGDNVFGTPIKWGLLAVIVGVPVGATVWRTTRIRKMPSSGSYRLFFALVAFLSCVAWIYYLAALAVDFVEALGSSSGISSSLLGLTFLAWGNSCGDLVTNVAVSRAGYPGMAIAGSYGGPLFNLLLGIGLPMIWNCSMIYPAPSVFKLDAVTIVTAMSSLAVLIGTLPTVLSEGYKFPPKAPMALLSAYMLYLVVEMVVTFA